MAVKYPCRNVSGFLWMKGKAREDEPIGGKLVSDELDIDELVANHIGDNEDCFGG